MNVVVQVENIRPPVLPAKGTLRLCQSSPHRSTLGIDEECRVKEDDEAIDGGHSRISIKERLEEVDHTELLLVLLVMYELDG